MLNGYRFLLYPNPEQEQILLQWIGCHRLIYNAKVQEDRHFRQFQRRSARRAWQFPWINVTVSSSPISPRFFVKCRRRFCATGRCAGGKPTNGLSKTGWPPEDQAEIRAAKRLAHLGTVRISTDHR
ncbi:MAG: helix-turn-helix domain-containing protein [Firmicutes bacterium]|nr:helix-turn-helix domain-containing protein [Bacillota bacterium]